MLSNPPLDLLAAYGPAPTGTPILAGLFTTSFINVWEAYSTPKLDT